VERDKFLKNRKNNLRSMIFCIMYLIMDTVIKYRGRVATSEDVAFINKLISQNPKDSRRALSIKLCREWNWTQPNGALRDMVCRGFMLELHRAGQIKLPPKKRTPNNPLVKRKKPSPVCIDQTLISTTLKRLEPLEFRQVRRTRYENLFNALMDKHHYLGYCQPVGEHLKFIVYTGKRPIACLAWCSAPRHIGCRDRFIGWDAKARMKNLHLMAYNTRFLILPWIRISHLASHILGRMVKMICGQWEKIYNHPIYYLETFVDKERFAGTCYKAANWTYIGDTAGLGKNSRSKKVNRSIKAVYGYPLTKNFREQLSG
jgi:hypothetical protein